MGDPTLQALFNDILKLRHFFQDASLARGSYRSLCNRTWIHNRHGAYECTWQQAATMIAKIRNKGEDFVDYIGMGFEGKLDDRFVSLMNGMGWSVK